MAQRNKKSSSGSTGGATVGYEAQLWQMADALRGSTDAAESKHVVLGLIFLESISDAFEEHHAKLVDDAMPGIERNNPGPKGVLPKDDARPALDKTRLGQESDDTTWRLAAPIGLPGGCPPTWP